MINLLVARLPGGEVTSYVHVQSIIFFLYLLFDKCLRINLVNTKILHANLYNICLIKISVLIGHKVVFYFITCSIKIPSFQKHLHTKCTADEMSISAQPK